MESHEPEATQLDVAGYRSCRNEWCGELTLLEIAERTGGLCTTCFRGDLGDKLTEIEVRVSGQRMTVPVRHKGTRKTKGNRATANAAEKANIRAMRRLKGLFPDLFEILVAEERARVGLEPFPVERVVKAPAGSPTVDESVDFARVLAALDEHGVDFK